MLRIETPFKEKLWYTGLKEKSHELGSTILIWVGCIILSFFFSSCTHYNRLVCSRYPRALRLSMILPHPFFLLKLLLFLEEHAEADDGSVNQQAAGDGHDHGFDSDEIGVREDGRKGCMAKV